MPEPTVPDELFDADFAVFGKHSLADRFNWIIQDGQLVHAPVVDWTRAWPKYGDECSPKGLACLASPHGTQHIASLVSVACEFPGSPPQSRLKHQPRQGGARHGDRCEHRTEDRTVRRSYRR